MIRVKALTRKYGNFTAVNAVSFEIPKGQIIGLLGHNGAGKTTTLKVLTGYLEPTEGQVFIDDLDITEHGFDVQKKIGYLSEASPLYPEMTIWQYLDYVAQLRGIPESQRVQAIKDAIQSTDLGDKALSPIDTLSKGYRQRVGVAQAIIHKPEILILDEPTNGLDPTQILAMRQLIKNLAKNATVIISTHIMQEVEAICDRVLIILQGKLVVDSTLEELQNIKNITLAVNQPLESLKPALQAIQGIHKVESMDSHDGLSHYRLHIAQGDVSALTPIVAKAIVEKGWELHQIQREHRNLESVFKEVNRNHGGHPHV